MSLVLVLIWLDQATKMFALAVLPPFECVGQGMAVQMHDSTMVEAMARSAIAGYCLLSLWLTDLPRPLLCLWTGASLSNCIEALVRQSVVDFLPFRAFGMACVANLADVYLALGLLAALAMMLLGKIRMADFVPLYLKGY